MTRDEATEWLHQPEWAIRAEMERRLAIHFLTPRPSSLEPWRTCKEAAIDRLDREVRQQLARRIA